MIDLSKLKVELKMLRDWSLSAELIVNLQFCRDHGPSHAGTILTYVRRVNMQAEVDLILCSGDISPYVCNLVMTDPQHMTRRIDLLCCIADMVTDGEFLQSSAVAIKETPGRRINVQCSGFLYVSFRASWIQIRYYLIRPVSGSFHQQAKNVEKNLDTYRIMTS